MTHEGSRVDVLVRWQAWIAGVLLIALAGLAGCSSSTPTTAPNSSTAVVPTSGPDTTGTPAEDTREASRVTQPCLASGDQNDIHARLLEPGDEAVLCQGALFELTGPIEFTAERQSLYTEGRPTDDRRAELRVMGKDQAVAVDGMWLDGVTLGHVIVDGGRRRLGFIEGPALLNFGYSSEDQVIEWVEARDPRGWTAIYASEGGDPPCRRVQIRNNVVRLSGSHYARADGISLACPNSVVENNTVIDATDGGIVIFQAPGSLVQNNTIRAETLSMTYGISMVDYMPFDGDFSGTIVRGNTIDAAGAVIKTGIAIGDATGCPGGPRARGGEVRGNVLKGTHMGYGFPVMAVEDWVVMDNRDESVHEPIRPTEGTCASGPRPEPKGFQIDSASSSGEFQEEYEAAELGQLLDPYNDPYYFDQECLAGLIGERVLEEIREGRMGSPLLAVEQTEGGQFLERCFLHLNAPADSSDIFIFLSMRECSPTCVVIALRNDESDAVDLSNVVFLIENFVVECVGLPDRVANEEVTCTIYDFIQDDGHQMLAVWGFRSIPRELGFAYPFEE